jgi:hypothetical protein
LRLEEAGVVWTEPNICSPLDELLLTLRYESLAGQPVTFEIQDADHETYFKATVISQPGQATIRVQPGGKLGVHYVTARVHLSETQSHTRWGSFRVEASTRIQSDNQSMDELLRLLGEGLNLSLDRFYVDGRPVTYHKCADNCCKNFCYPAFFIPAVRYFFPDLKPMLDVLYDHQWPSGRLPDHVYGDDHPGWERKSRIRSMMADLETGAVSTLYKAWVESTRKQIENIGFSTEYVGDTVSEISQVFTLFRVILGAFGLIAMIVAALGAFNTLTISLLERVREVGLFKALGMRNKDVYKLFLAESIIIGITGGLIGLFFGTMLGNLINVILSFLAQKSGAEQIQIFITPWTFSLSVAGFSIIVGFLTGWYPSRRAVKINPLDALKYE